MIKNKIIKNIDWITVLIYLALVIFGWVNIYAANYNPDNTGFFDINKEYTKQLIWFGLSLVIIWLILMTDSKFYTAFAGTMYGLSILLLFSVIFLGKEINGAKSWFELGPVRFQPVELAKVATALTISSIISKYGFSFKKRKDLLKILAIWLAPVLCILLQNDTGSALVFFVLILPLYREGFSGNVLLLIIIGAIVSVFTIIYPNYIILLSIATISLIVLFYKTNLKTIGIALAIGCGVFLIGLSTYAILKQNYLWELLIVLGTLGTSIYLIYIAIKNKLKAIYPILLFLWGAIIFTLSTDYFVNKVLSQYQRTRVEVLLGFKDDPLGAGYNVNQSKISIGSGGLTGKGYLQGTQTKFDFVPEQSTDFIFCTVGEEWGFLGTTLVICMFLFLMIRIVILAERQHSTFSRVYGYCVASIFFFHFCINIGMTIGLAPVIGIPLPFFSYGGSSLWGFTALLFIFLKLDTDRAELIR